MLLGSGGRYRNIGHPLLPHPLNILYVGGVKGWILPIVSRKRARGWQREGTNHASRWIFLFNHASRRIFLPITRHIKRRKYIANFNFSTLKTIRVLNDRNTLARPLWVVYPINLQNVPRSQLLFHLVPECAYGSCKTRKVLKFYCKVLEIADLEKFWKSVKLSYKW